jgi:hypothetical protein
MEFLEHIASEIEQTGHTVVRGERSFLIDPLGLQIEVEVGERKEHNVNGRHSVVHKLTIKATHADLFPNGIFECIGAAGKDDEDAFAYGTRVFAPIHECLVPFPTEGFEVQRLDMVSRNDETDENLGWKVYLGPLQAAGEFAEGADFQSDYLLLSIYNELIPYLYESRLFWIKIYIAKFSDGQVMADVWLNNADWPQALNRIQNLIAARQNVTSYSALRQFIVIQPCSISEIKNAENLIGALPPKPKKGLLSRLFRRN